MTSADALVDETVVLSSVLLCTTSVPFPPASPVLELFHVLLTRVGSELVDAALVAGLAVELLADILESVVGGNVSSTLGCMLTVELLVGALEVAVGGGALAVDGILAVELLVDVLGTVFNGNCFILGWRPTSAPRSIALFGSDD